MITHYLTVAIRNLLKYKTQNLISIAGLAVGLFCFSICFYISRYIGSVDKCFEKHERIAEISLFHSNGGNVAGVSGHLLAALRQRTWNEVECFTHLSYSQRSEYNIIGKNGEVLPYELTNMEADSLYYRVFTPTVLAGSWEQATHNRNSVVLTRHTAKKLFTDIHNAIGKQLLSPHNRWYKGGTISYTVQAVIEDIPGNTSMNFMRTIDMLTVNDDDGYENIPTNDITGYNAYALLKERCQPEQLNQSFKEAGFTFHIFQDNSNVLAEPLGKDQDFITISRIMVWVTSIIGLLILLAASLNFFHFQTGNFLNRGREFGIRKILGNTTSGLFWMQFVQIVLVILPATLVAGCLIELSTPFLHLSLFRFSLQMPKEELLEHLMQYMGTLILLTALVAFGIALYVRRATLQASLQSYGKVNGKKYLRNTLLGIQFFICWLFVALATGLYLQSEKTSSAMFSTLSRQEKKEIIYVPLDYRFLKAEDRQVFISKIRQHAGIKDIMYAHDHFVSNSITTLYESFQPQKYHETRIMRITSNYAEFMNIGLEGRGPQKQDEIMITRNMASKLEGNAIGKTLYDYNQNGFTITGISDDFTNYVYNDGYGQADYSTVYFYINENESGEHAYVKCHPGKVDEVQERIEQILHEILPASIEPRISTFQEEIENYQALENKLKGIILSFSIICLIITLLGVYSAITLDTERRQKEVAIRKVNGAGLEEIILLFARLYLWMLGVSFIAAFPIVMLVLQQWKRMYTVFFNDGVLYWGGILIGVTLITALTVIFRILKIARINPAEIIKSE